MESKKVLVTGGCGFMGRWVAKSLVDKGYETYIIDDLSGSTLGNIEEFEDDLAGFYEVNLSDSERTLLTIEDIRPETVFHLAASAREGASFFDPVRMCKTNYMSYMNTLESSIKTGSLDKMVVFSCHDRETRLVTTNGIKNYTDIDVNDKVYTLNKLTHNIEIKPINKIIINHYKGKMLKFSGRASLCVTPNHRMLYVKSVYINPRLEFEPASKSFRRAYIKLPVASWEGQKYEDIFELDANLWRTKRQSTEIMTEDLFYMIGLFVADGVKQIYVYERESKTGLDFETYMSNRNEYGRFISPKSSIAERRLTRTF